MTLARTMALTLFLALGSTAGLALSQPGDEPALQPPPAFSWSSWERAQRARKELFLAFGAYSKSAPPSITHVSGTAEEVHVTMSCRAREGVTAVRVLTLRRTPRGDKVVSVREELPAGLLRALEKNESAIVAAAEFVRCRCPQGVTPKLTKVYASMTKPGEFEVRVERSDSCGEQVGEVRVDLEGKVLKEK